MNIHQVTVSYVREQDRLLIRINDKSGTELQAWLTRRLALALLPVLSKISNEQMQKVADSDAPATNLEDKREQLMSAFEKEGALRGGDFKTPYKKPPENMPAGPQPLLLTEIKVTPLEGGLLQLVMLEKLPGQENTRNLQFELGLQLSHGLLQLLHQGLKQSEWLQTPVISEDTDLFADSGSAELPDEPTKPKYLN
jgi:hypothetical protein